MMDIAAFRREQNKPAAVRIAGYVRGAEVIEQIGPTFVDIGGEKRRMDKNDQR